MGYKKCFIVSSLVFVIITGFAFAQQDTRPTYFFEVHYASQTGYADRKDQAEIVGDIDSLYYDNMKHYTIGFKANSAIEIVAGYYKNWFQLQSTISYGAYDIGLGEAKFSGFNEGPFVLANMLSIKTSALFPWNWQRQRNIYVFNYGLFISSTFPVSYKMNAQRKSKFAIKDFKPTNQLNLGVDLNLAIRIINPGWHIRIGFSATMLGTGGLGKIELEPNSLYTLTRDNVRRSITSGFIGIGYCLEK